MPPKEAFMSEPLNVIEYSQPSIPEKASRSLFSDQTHPTLAKFWTETPNARDEEGEGLQVGKNTDISRLTNIHLKVGRIERPEALRVPMARGSPQSLEQLPCLTDVSMHTDALTVERIT